MYLQNKFLEDQQVHHGILEIKTGTVDQIDMGIKEIS